MKFRLKRNPGLLKASTWCVTAHIKCDMEKKTFFCFYLHTSTKVSGVGLLHHLIVTIRLFSGAKKILRYHFITFSLFVKDRQ